MRIGLGWCLALVIACVAGSAREHKAPSAKVTVQAGQGACLVDLDSQSAGATDPSGSLVIKDVDPGDHYLHVQCPGKGDAVYLISPKLNEETHIGPAPDPAPLSGADGNSQAEKQLQLRRLVQQSVQLRAEARLGEAVVVLREAVKLDPENSDLHRELGITFLMEKDWKRARVELIEAIRHSQGDADAHSGLAYALEKLGDIQGAVKEYRAATQIEPDDSTYRTHYFDALVRLQSQQEPKK